VEYDMLFRWIRMALIWKTTSRLTILV